MVALSSIGGELASGNGFIASLHRQERRLRALDRANLMILRPGAFFEGFYAALDTIRHEGVVADSVAPEAKVPMIATADIAAVAAGALRARNWSGVVVRELIGPRELTYTEAAAAIGAAIGQPDLQYLQLPDEELVAILTEAAGFSPDFAALFVEFNQALSEGRAALARGSQPEQHDPDRVRGVRRRARTGLRGDRVTPIDQPATPPPNVARRGLPTGGRAGARLIPPVGGGMAR